MMSLPILTLLVMPWRNHSINKIAATQAFRLCYQQMGRNLFVFHFESTWVLRSVHHAWLYPRLEALAPKYPSYSVLRYFMPWCLFCTCTNVGCTEHLPETPSVITTEHLLWMASFLFNRLLHLCRAWGSGFLAVRHGFSGNFSMYLYFSPSPFRNLRNHPLLAVRGFLSLLQGTPGGRVPRGSVLSGVTHGSESEQASVHVFRPHT